MLGDRLFGRAKQAEFIVFDNTSRENELREKNWDMNIQKAYELGKGFFKISSGNSRQFNYRDESVFS